MSHVEVVHQQLECLISEKRSMVTAYSKGSGFFSIFCPCAMCINIILVLNILSSSSTEGRRDQNHRPSGIKRERYLTRN